jgi:16S rRNA (cytosine967-C5)-methyltransferase
LNQVNERKIALEILLEVEKGGYLNLIMKNKLRDLPVQTRRFIAALVYTTLENRIRIDYVIAQFTDGKSIQVFVRNVLRMSVAQLLFFETVPESAVVNEAVKIIAHSKKRQLKGFANAVLRNIAAHIGEIDYPKQEENPALFLSVMYSYPLWIVEKYIMAYGFDFTWEMLSYHKQEAWTTLRANTLKTSREEVEKKLTDGGYEVLPGLYHKDALQIKSVSEIDKLSLFQKGEITVQGEASMLVCEAAGVKRGEDILDACAAPGGKTALLACAYPRTLTAWDIHAHRVTLMEENFARLGVTAETVMQDATEYTAAYEQAFDVVLVDAPCSALGLLYRKPDIKYAKTDGDLEALVTTQAKILEVCARYVKPGGRLIYSTCTINDAENAQQIKTILEKYDCLKRGDLKNTLPAQFAARANAGEIQFFPHLDGIDGFYIAVLERRDG